MGKELDSRVVEFAYVDRFVLNYKPNRSPGQTVTETILQERGQTVTDESGKTSEQTLMVPVEIKVPLDDCRIKLLIKYELQDKNKNILGYKESQYDIYIGDENKTVVDILKLLNEKIIDIIYNDKKNLSGFNFKIEEPIIEPIVEVKPIIK